MMIIIHQNYNIPVVILDITHSFAFDKEKIQNLKFMKSLLFFRLQNWQNMPKLTESVMCCLQYLG